VNSGEQAAHATIRGRPLMSKLDWRGEPAIHRHLVESMCLSCEVFYEESRTAGFGNLDELLSRCL
jgi:hypothetical protein